MLLSTSVSDNTSTGKRRHTRTCLQSWIKGWFQLLFRPRHSLPTLVFMAWPCLGAAVTFGLAASNVTLVDVSYRIKNIILPSNSER